VPFRRERRPLHERLASDGGLDWRGRDDPHAGRREPEVLEPVPPRIAPALEGGHRAREWDAVRTTEEPGPPVGELDFVVVDEELVVVEGEEDVPESMLAAFEGALAPPYRVHAVRKGEALWSLGARRIELVELEDVEGEELELVVRGGSESLRTHGGGSVAGNDAALFRSVRTLKRSAEERRFRDYVVRAERIDGALWEVSITPL